jgi:hypothetical protein
MVMDTGTRLQVGPFPKISFFCCQKPMKTINEAIREFLKHCKYERNLGDKTIKAYTIDLVQFSDGFQLRLRDIKMLVMKGMTK